MDAATNAQRSNRVTARLIGLGAIIGGIGAWSFLHPSSFFEQIATYPPYNAHMLRDGGAFLLGLGVAFLAAAALLDAITVALVANAASAVLHAISHGLDADVEASFISNPIVVSIVAVVFVLASIRRLRARR